MAERAPKGLQAAGRRLWRDVTARFELDAPELAVLTAACRTADLLDVLAVDLDANAVEHRQQAITLSRLVASLRLPDEEGGRAQRRSGVRGHYAARRDYGALSVIE